MENKITSRRHWMEELAFEAALGYYTPEELQLKYDLSPERYRAIAATPVFSRAKNTFRRQIDEEGQQFRVKARKMAAECLDVLFQIAGDPREATSDRISAVQALCRYAGMEKGVEVSSGNNAFSVNIQINQ